VRAFKLRSPALGPGGEIPPKYTCDGSESHPRFAGPSRPRAPQGLPSSWLTPTTRSVSRSIGSSMESPSASASSLRVSPARARWPEWEPRA